MATELDAATCDWLPSMQPDAVLREVRIGTLVTLSDGVCTLTVKVEKDASDGTLLGRVATHADRYQFGAVVRFRRNHVQDIRGVHVSAIADAYR
jgi:hypothetical protein